MVQESRNSTSQASARRRANAKRRKKQAQRRRLLLLVLAGVLVLVAVIILVKHSAAPEPDPQDPEASRVESTGDSAPDESQPATEPVEENVGTDVLAEYSSPNYGGYNRTVNMQLACEAIDGTVIPADGIFSFNEIVGERTEEKGYLPAGIYAAGTTQDEIGGGICQVASTIYLVAMKADMEIVERRCHQFTVNYLPLGMDASIYWDGNQDFQFKNTSGHPIRVCTAVEGGVVNVSIEGTKKDDTYIRIDYEVLATYEPEEIEQINWLEDSDYSEVISTPITGYYVQTYRCVYAADGTLLSRTKEATSNYFKRDKITEVGPPEPADKRQAMPVEDEAEPSESIAVQTEPTDAPVPMSDDDWEPSQPDDESAELVEP